MPAGRLKWRAELLRAAELRDALGGVQQQWQLQKTVWADLQRLGSRELLAAQAEQSRVSVRILLRPQRQLDERWRVRIDGQTYNITGIGAEIDGLMQLLCERGDHD